MAEIIDDEGKLLGIVNVIDALVVLSILAIAVAGASLVFGAGAAGNGDSGPSGETTTQYVTLDLGTQPDYIVTALNEGDTSSPATDTQLTVTDVYLSPTGDRTQVLVRARLEAPARNGSMNFTGASPRLGRSLEINTSRYQVSGAIRAVGTNESLNRETTTVVLNDRMAASDARAVTAGDRIRIGGRTIATVEDVAVYPTETATERAVFVEASVGTYRQQGERMMGTTPVRPGQTLQLRRDAYTIEGDIQRVGDGLTRNRTAVVFEDTVDSETARAISEDTAVSVANEDIATIANVSTYNTDTPGQKRIVVGATLETLTYDGHQQFGTTPIRRGNEITLDSGEFQLSGPIQRVGASAQRGTVTTRTVRLRSREVDADLAAPIRAGLTEQAGGDQYARITDVETAPSPIIATGDDGSVNVADHPTKRDVTITARLRVRETSDGLQFKGRSLRQGSRVTLDLGTITIEPTVVAIDR